MPAAPRNPSRARRDRQVAGLGRDFDAFVREDVHGDPREVHLLIRPGPEPRALATDVRELLEERLGVPVAQRITSIAQRRVSAPEGVALLAGGTGLSPSPADALQRNRRGYVDHVNAQGQIVGQDENPPEDGVYTRRWSIEPLPTNPNNTLVFQVFVTTPERENRRGGEKRVRLPGDAWLVSVKTRKAQ